MIYHEQYTDHDITYTVSPDPPPQVSRRPWGLVRLNVTDELTGLPPRGALRISTTFPRLTAATAEGLAGFVGIPVEAFPGHQATAYNVDYNLQAERFLERSSTFPVPADGAFPGSFTPAPVQQVGLHRSPTIIHGRVYSTGAVLTPAAGANVTLTGYWTLIPPTGAALAPNLLSLQMPAYLDRSAAGTVRARALPPVAGQDKHLLEQFAPGSTQILLSDRVGIAIGSVLAVDPANTARVEYLPITSIQGATTPNQPARVGFAYAPRIAHSRDTLVQRVAPGALGANNNLAADVIPGDACLRLGSMVALAAGVTVEVNGGGAGPEYHSISVFSAVSDAQGYYRLPPASRAAQLRLDINDHVNPILTVLYQPVYEFEQNLIDFQIPV